MTDNPPPSGGYPPQGGNPPSQGGSSTPQGGYSPPPQGGYPPPPQGYYPPSQQSRGYAPPPGAALPKESYTSWITRVAAWFIDYIPVFLIMGITQGIAILTGDNDCVTYDSSVACTSSYSVVGTLVSILGYALSLAYAVWNYGYRQGTTGSSIGKSVMKFKVVSEKTWQPIGFGLSIVRQLAHFVDAIICYIGYLFPLWDAKRQTLADKIMTTVCVPLNPQPLPPGPTQY
ncbi:MAG: RDD family protein [Mycobacterium sp.]